MNKSVSTSIDDVSQTVPRTAWYLIGIPFLLWIVLYQNDWNTAVFLHLNKSFAHLPDLVWTALSLFGNGWSVFAIVLPLMYIAPRTIYAALITGVFAGILANLTKAYFDMPRPAGVLDPLTFHIIESPLYHSAMPSGHTMTAFAIGTAILFSAPVRFKKLLLPIWLIAISTGLSRIAVGAHWPSDVLIGASIGIFCGLLGASIALKISEQANQPFSLAPAIIVLFSILDMYVLIENKLDFHINRPIQLLLVFVLAVNFMIYFFCFRKHRQSLRNHV